MNLRISLFGTAVFISACQNMPQPYAPPVQRQPFENARPYRMSRLVAMADGDADAHIVRDIPPQSGGSWRWTGQKPTIHVTPRTRENLKYIIDFALADATMKETGPVTLSFLVNDHLLDRVHYDAPGQFHFEKAVPSEWLAPSADTTLAAEIDKVWVSPTDGAKLGFILTRIGLTQ